MTQFGYTLNSEQSGPIDMVDYAVLAENSGYDFLVASDHYSPWLESQGHAPYLWSVLGAVARDTKHVPLYSYVTCPILRYHPVVVAQKAATMQILSNGRFNLGLGSGENLNEHVIGEGWPHVDERQARLVEATHLIRRLLDGETVDHRGDYYKASAAKLWDLPVEAPPIGIAAGGPKAARIAGEMADFLVAVDAKKSLVDEFVAAGGEGKGRVAQVLVCWDPDYQTAVNRAYEQAAWLLLGWGAITALATPAEFKAAVSALTPEAVAAAIPCGPDVEPIVEAVGRFVDLGYEEVALMQVGGDSQPGFISWSETTLLRALREAFPDGS